MKQKIILLAVTLFITLSLPAQDKANTISHAFGYNAGFTTGVGLSYQMMVNNKWGLQLSGTPFIFSPQQHWISAGGTGIYKIRDRKKVDLAAYVGIHLISSRTTVIMYNPSDDTTKVPMDYVGQPETKTVNHLNVGAGIGFEFDLGSSFYFNLMGGFGAYNLSKIVQVYPSLETSLFYKL